MLTLYLLLYIAPIVGALMLGLVIALVVRRRSSAVLSRSTRVIIAISAAVGILISVAPKIIEFSASVWNLPALRSWAWNWIDSTLGFTTPLLAGILAVFIMSFALGQGTRHTGADLTRRSAFVFAPRGALIATGASAVAAVILAIAAGRASSTDDEGRYVMYWIDGGLTQAGTKIYGWYFSLPALTVLALLLGLTLFTLWRISKPPLGSDPISKHARRRQLGAFVSYTTLSALLLHLSDISTSLRGTSTLRFSGGGMHGWSTFAALGPAFNVAGIALSFLGVTIWAYVFWRSVLGSPAKKLV